MADALNLSILGFLSKAITICPGAGEEDNLCKKKLSK